MLPCGGKGRNPWIDPVRASREGAEHLGLDGNIPTQGDATLGLGRMLP